jgi:O-antigen ligase
MSHRRSWRSGTIDWRSTLPTSIPLVLLLLLVAAAPIPYGAILPSATVRLQLLAFLAAAASLARGPLTPLRRTAVPLAAATALALFGLFQLAPLGDSAIGTLSPGSAGIYHTTAELLRSFGETDPPESRISIAPQETMQSVLLILSYAAAMLAAVITLDTRRRRRLFIWGVVLVGALHVVYAASEESFRERLSGTFVNPNHLAGYLLIALSCAFGLVWSDLLVSRDRVLRARDEAEKIERRWIPVIPRLLLWSLIGGGIALTQSRGGVTAAVLSTLLLFALAALQRRRTTARRGITVVTAAGVVAATLFIVWATGSSAVARFTPVDASDISRDTRLRTYEVALDAWREFPTFGAGLGAFREAFRRVQPRDLPGLFEYAHNDALQLLVGGGIIGLLLGLVVVGGTLVLLFRLWLGQPHREESALCLAAFGAVVALVVHGIVDFNLSVPGITVTLAAVAGMGIAAGIDEQPHKKRVVRTED